MVAGENAARGLSERALTGWSAERRRPRQLLAQALFLFALAFALASLVGMEDHVNRIAATALGPLGLLVAAVSVLFELVRLALRRRLTRGAWLHLPALGFLVFSPFAGAFAAAIVAEVRNERFVVRMQEACQGLMARLEAHRQSTGAYPDRIESCLDGSDLAHPEFLAEIRYRRDGRGERYALWFFDLLENLGGRSSVHVYDSKRATWFFSDDSSFDFSFTMLDGLRREEREHR